MPFDMHVIVIGEWSEEYFNFDWNCCYDIKFYRKSFTPHFLKVYLKGIYVSIWTHYYLKWCNIYDVHVDTNILLKYTVK